MVKVCGYDDDDDDDEDDDSDDDTDINPVSAKSGQGQNSTKKSQISFCQILKTISTI